MKTSSTSRLGATAPLPLNISVRFSTFEGSRRNRRGRDGPRGPKARFGLVVFARRVRRACLQRGMRSLRFTFALPNLALLTATALACGGSSDATVGCNALSACCSTLSSVEAQSCQTSLAMQGVTDALCTQALMSIQSAGLCGGVGTSAAADGGAEGGPRTGCTALGACCPELPASEVPQSCLTVVMEGTAGACAESLVQYQSDGYCVADAGPPDASLDSRSDAAASAGSVNCLVTTSGVEECIGLRSTTIDAAICSPLGGTSVSACPAANRSGCCEDIPEGDAGSVLGIRLICFYDLPSSDTSTEQSTCASMRGTWSAD